MESGLKIENLSHILNDSLQEVQSRKEIREFQQQSPSGQSIDNFSGMLSRAIEQVNLDQVQADQAIKEMVSGRNKNIHETMLAVEKADMSLKMLMQVRNKVLDAYREIMRMQV